MRPFSEPKLITGTDSWVIEAEEDEGHSTKSKKAKVPSQGKSTARQTSVTAKGVDSEDERDSAPKKKKRKINLFPSAQPTSFNWGELSQVRVLLRHRSRENRSVLVCLRFVI